LVAAGSSLRRSGLLSAEGAGAVGGTLLAARLGAGTDQLVAASRWVGGEQHPAEHVQARHSKPRSGLEVARVVWLGRRRGRLTFDRWADEWWAARSTDPDRSPTTLAATENRLRPHVRPWFGQRPRRPSNRRWCASCRISSRPSSAMRADGLPLDPVPHPPASRRRRRHPREPAAPGAPAQAAGRS
jgi:hypothetical protein